GYHQSAVGHLSPFIHECRTYYLNSRAAQQAARAAVIAYRAGFQQEAAILWRAAIFAYLEQIK
ncbi:hypothetical protein, partial [Aeromonas dhakensis]|uniref:hypothetical protein n=1 Tax=Aeromonas dhakensis TaxID=196024 RepID=UPI0039885A7F